MNSVDDKSLQSWRQFQTPIQRFPFDCALFGDDCLADFGVDGLGDGDIQPPTEDSVCIWCLFMGGSGCGDGICLVCHFFGWAGIAWFPSLRWSLIIIVLDYCVMLVMLNVWG